MTTPARPQPDAETAASNSARDHRALSARDPGSALRVESPDVRARGNARKHGRDGTAEPLEIAESGASWRRVESPICEGKGAG